MAGPVSASLASASSSRYWVTPSTPRSKSSSTMTALTGIAARASASSVWSSPPRSPTSTFGGRSSSSAAQAVANRSRPCAIGTFSSKQRSRTDSSTVRPGSGSISWPIRATEENDRTTAGSSARLCPATDTDPMTFFIRPVSASSRLVRPVPDGPTTAATVPRARSCSRPGRSARACSAGSATSPPPRAGPPSPVRSGSSSGCSVACLLPARGRRQLPAWANTAPPGAPGAPGSAWPAGSPWAAGSPCGAHGSAAGLCPLVTRAAAPTRSPGLLRPRSHGLLRPCLALRVYSDRLAPGARRPHRDRGRRQLARGSARPLDPADPPAPAPRDARRTGGFVRPFGGAGRRPAGRRAARSPRSPPARPMARPTPRPDLMAAPSPMSPPSNSAKLCPSRPGDLRRVGQVRREPAQRPATRAW